MFRIAIKNLKKWDWFSFSQDGPRYQVLLCKKNRSGAYDLLYQTDRGIRYSKDDVDFLTMYYKHL